MDERRALRRIQRHVANLAYADNDVAMRAGQTLIRTYGPRALEPLLESCRHPSAQVRFLAVWALAHTRDPRALESILRLTADRDPRVRYDAVMGLGVHGDARGLPTLLEWVQQPDDGNDTAGAAAMALVRMGEVAIPAVERLLNEANLPNRDRLESVLRGLHGEEDD